MGEGIADFFNEKVKKEYKIAFFITFIVTLLIHLYKFTNTIPNHDSILNYYSNQNMIGSGRWALSIACGFSSFFDLPWVIGLISCLFISLTVVIIVALFKVKNSVLIGIIAALIASSPAITETFFYLFTADGYMIAMFLAALSVYLSRIDIKGNLQFILSGICICISCAIYQSYVSFALVLATCYFIDILIQNKYSKEQCINWVFRQIIIYSLSLLCYFIIWKFLMNVFGVIPNDYQGISKVGKLDIMVMVYGLLNAIITTFNFFININSLKHGFDLYSILNIIFLIFMIVGIVNSVFKSGMFHKKWAIVLLLLCIIMIIPFTCIWNFTSNSIIYRAMMLQSLVILYILTAVLFERYFDVKLKNVVCLLLIVITFNNAVNANISYFYLNLANEKTREESIELMIRIHNLKNYDQIKTIAIIGNRNSNNIEINDSYNSNRIITEKYIPYNSYILNNNLYSERTIYNYLKTNYGLDMKLISKKKLNSLSNIKEVKEMKCWPKENSIKVIDNVLIIKLGKMGEY